MATASALLIDEYYEAADERFLPEVLGSQNAKKLKAFADRWYRDKRPFARRALLAYIDDGCDRPHHRPLVKALFKMAEQAQDDEAMGHFLVAFDRLLRRRMKQVRVWDTATRSYVKEGVLRLDPRIPARLGSRENRAPQFSRRTRTYLCRRAFRYFRVIARTDEARYGRAVRAALVLYEDRHLERPEQLLDAWGLLHALYWGSDVLDRDPRGIRVKDGRSMADLTPAPFAPGAWRGAFEDVLDLVTRARSRTVRVFAVAWLRRAYDADLRGLPLRRARALLRSPHDEVQTFAVELLRNASGVHNLSIEEWLELLRIDNPTALPILCDLVAKTVSPGRLSLAQCVDLACAKAAPVAELGLRWARQKPVNDEPALAAVIRLAQAGAPTVRAEGLAWITEIMTKSSFAKAAHVRDILDARYADVRAHGLALVEHDARFQNETALWAALAESPYDDARGFLVKHLDARQKAFGAATLRHVWATTLLAVRRGGKAKRGALDQIAARLARHPAEADSLLPLLGIALRSVRAPERRTALAAVARAAVHDPALTSAISRVLPELTLVRGAVL